MRLRTFLGFDEINLARQIMQKQMGREDPPYSSETVEEMIARAERKYPGFATKFKLTPYEETLGDGIQQPEYALQAAE